VPENRLGAAERLRAEFGPDVILRAGVLVFDQQRRLLLVRQRWLRDGTHIWRPPGGALDPGPHPLDEVAALETLLETGLRVEPGRLVLLWETSSEQGLRSITAYFLARVKHGDLISGLDYANGPLELAVLEGARYCSRAELQALPVRPTYLQDGLWTDLAAGFREAPRLRTVPDTALPATSTQASTEPGLGANL